jgi:hypothetical protein
MATKKTQRPNQGRPPQGRVTKAERKDQARQERQAILQQMARRKRNGRILVGAAVVVAIGAGAILLTQSGSTTNSTTLSPSTPPPVNVDTLPGLITNTDTTSWTANTAQLAGRLAILQLGTLSDTVLHIHAHLDLYVNGQPVTVPADIGLASNASSPLHVHEGEPGVIHIESANANAQYYLGNFFDVWGLKLTSTCVGGFCNGNGSTLTAYVNGKQWTGDPRNIPLAEHEEIVLAFGTKSQLPNPIPSSFNFGQYGL